MRRRRPCAGSDAGGHAGQRFERGGDEQSREIVGDVRKCAGFVQTRRLLDGAGRDQSSRGACAQRLVDARVSRLCLFAKRDYQQSAAALYAVLSAGPGWDLATVQGLYSTPGAYTDQLLALKAYRDEHPAAADARFVLAYHFLLAGQNQQAETELAKVVELEPKDQLSAQLLAGLRAKPPAELPPDGAAPELPVAAPPEDAAPSVKAADLVGNWKANRADGSKFELDISEDGKFRWNFSQQDKQQEFSGSYTLANNLLILSASGQNALVGQVSLAEGDKLQFKLAGGSAADPGLTFTR